MYGPTRHFTIVFNTLVMLNWFNFFNCRKMTEELNIFQGEFFHYFKNLFSLKGISKSKIFLSIVFSIFLLQIVIVEYGGRAFGCYKDVE